GREDFVSEDIIEMMISHLGELSGINEVAAFFHISRSTVRYYIEQWDFVSLQIGKRIVIVVLSMGDFIKRYI
ncbi:helix-turn-helix domain-containing protein, partial [Fusobacterium necrophorum]|nr:helix-turn-helix domain-containing protein [Fusobacterium necrophorum]